VARTTENTNYVNVLLVSEVQGEPLKRKRICITGHLSAKRTDWEEVIRTAGGELVPNVTGGVDYLLTNKDWNKGTKSAKFKKAQDLRVKIISEDEMLNILFKS